MIITTWRKLQKEKVETSPSPLVTTESGGYFDNCRNKLGHPSLHLRAFKNEKVQT